MAHISEVYCNECLSLRTHINGKCEQCRVRKYREAQAAWLAKTQDEKLLDLHKRVMQLEQGPIRY